MAARLCRVWEKHLDCVGFLLPHTQRFFERLHRLASLLLKSVRKNARTSEGAHAHAYRAAWVRRVGWGCQSHAHLKLLALAFLVGRFDALAAEAVNERLPCLILRQLAHATLHRVAAQSSLQRKDVCSRACAARVHNLQPPFVCVIHADEVPVAGFGRRLLPLEDDAALHTPCPVRTGLGSAARACTGLTLCTFCPVRARAPFFPVCSHWNSYGSASLLRRSTGAGASEKKASKQPDVSGLSFKTLTETEAAAGRGVSLSLCAWLFDSFDFFFPSLPIASSLQWTL